MSEPILLSLPDLSPPLAVEVLPKGLIVNRFLVNVDGKTHDLVVGPSDPSLHGQRPHKYQNTIIGRYTNRLPTGDLLIEKNGIKASVSPLQNEHPKVSLHGGPEGFDTREWKQIDVSKASLFSESEKKVISGPPSSAILSHVSEDGDQGFPGRLLVEVLVAVSSGVRQGTTITDTSHVGSFYIVYRAKLLEGKHQITPLNLTQHWGFNLEASLAKKGEPTPDILNHKLMIRSDNTIGLDELALSTGKLHPVEGTAFNQVGRPIGENFPQGGHDQFHLFRAPISPIESIRLPISKLPSLNLFEEVLAAPARANPPVTLSSERSGWTLTFDTNQPGVQFYSAKFFDGSGTRKPIHGWSGHIDDGYGPHTFAFLEFHEALAAWLHPETAVCGDTLLTEGELYNNFVRIDVLFRPPSSTGAKE